MAINVTALTTYTDEHKEPIIKEVLYGAPSAKLLNIMSDVKGDTMLNILRTNVVFGDGTTCGFTDSSSSVMTQRKLAPVALKVNMAWCQRALIKYWANFELNVKIGVETLPFEEKFVGDAISDVSKQLDKMIWRGDKDNTNQFDGLFTIASDNAAAVSPAVHVVTPTSTLDGNLWNKLTAVINAIPSETYNKTIVVMSVTSLRECISKFEAANPYKNLEFLDGDKLSFIYPNSTVKVYGLNALELTTSETDMLAFNPETAFYGCDYEEAVTSYNFRYDDHFEQFELHQLFNAGTQFAFLDEVVIAKTYVAPQVQNEQTDTEP